MTLIASLRFSFAILMLALLAPSPAHAQFGGLGGLLGKVKTVKNAGDALRNIGEEEEIKIGSSLAGVILGAAPLVSNPAEQHYVNRLGTWLAQHSERAGLPWKFGIIDSPDVNAFSTPGGNVLITRGLFERMRSESELAGVLAHEIAHVVQRHHLKALQKSMGNSALGDVGKSFVSTGGGLAGAMTAKLIEGGKEVFIKGLDKADEYEADRMGVVIAARSGYSPYGLVGVLQTLSASPTDGSFALMFKTHPTPTARIERLDSSMGTKLDVLPGLVDDLPSFVRLRNPEQAAQPARNSGHKSKSRPRKR